MAETSYKEHAFRNTHLEKYRSVFARALYFQNSQVTYAKEKKSIQVVL